MKLEEMKPEDNIGRMLRDEDILVLYLDEAKLEDGSTVARYQTIDNKIVFEPNRKPDENHGVFKLKNGEIITKKDRRNPEKGETYLGFMHIYK